MPDWLMRLVQALIMLAVSWAAIYGKWTENGYVIGFMSVGAAYAFTVTYIKIADWIFLWKRRRITPLERELHDLLEGDER